MKRLVILLVGLIWLAGTAAAERAEYKIVTASERGTYIQIGRDLAKWVAAPAGIDLEVAASKGSSENVSRLRFEPGVKFALVQSDVYQAMLDESAAGNTRAGQMIRPLRVIMPLYDEEIYFVVRADSPLTAIHEIRNKKINVGPVGSGTALSATTLYRQIFGEQIPEATTTFLSNEEALLKLTSGSSIDVVVIVAGQPAKLFADMKPEARQIIKFLRFDVKGPGATEVIKTYYPTTIRASSYPSWLTSDVPTLAVKAFLVTYDYDMQQTQYFMKRFSKALCLNFDNLQAHGHPKWKQVSLALPELGKGWKYYPATARALRECQASRPESVNSGTGGTSTGCTQQERVLGLCSR